MKVQLLVRSYSSKYGLSRYTESICNALQSSGTKYAVITPEYPLWVKAAHKILEPFGFDTKRFFTTYPMDASVRNGAITHLTTQQMATILWRKPQLHPAVVTVHDIVPHLVRRNKEQDTFRHPFDYIFDDIAMKSLLKADQLIAISQYTKKTLIENLGCPEEKIKVILYGVDHELFKPVEVTNSFREKYNLPDKFRYLVYVGSESPRKNLNMLVQVFARLKIKHPELKLIKVGTPEYLKQFNQLKNLIQELELEDDVIFINHPPEEDLVTFYNLADVFVFPSKYEGFGMPPLEAMACRAPVVCSNAASLPEVVGDAALTFDPYDVEAMAAAIGQVLEDPALATTLRQKGLARARQFTWERTAQETIAVYEKVLGKDIPGSP